MAQSPRTSHSLSRRQSSFQAAGRPSLRQRSNSRPAVLTTPVKSPSSEADGYGSSALDLLSPTSSSGLTPGGSTRKSKLVTQLVQRDEADKKERDRELRKKLLSEKRNTSQALTQTRHAMNEAQSKVKRGSQEVNKVQDELNKLEKWRQGQDVRLKQLFEALREEERQLEQEFERKHSEADDIRMTLTVERDHLQAELEEKEDEVHKVEVYMQHVDSALQELDAGCGVTWNGGWKDEVRGLLDGTSPLPIGGSKMQGSDNNGSAWPVNRKLTLSADFSFGGDERFLMGGTDDGKAISRSEERPIPAPISASSRQAAARFSGYSAQQARLPASAAQAERAPDLRAHERGRGSPTAAGTSPSVKASKDAKADGLFSWDM